MGPSGFPSMGLAWPSWSFSEPQVEETTTLPPEGALAAGARPRGPRSAGGDALASGEEARVERDGGDGPRSSCADARAGGPGGALRHALEASTATTPAPAAKRTSHSLRT